MHFRCHRGDTGRSAPALAARNNLAQGYTSAGDLGRAISLYQPALSDALRVLGPEHPARLTFRNNLAGAYQAAGNPGRAIPLYEQILQGRVRILGPDHPDTLTSRNNLAQARRQAGLSDSGDTGSDNEKD